MSPLQVYELLRDAQSDYIGMVREMNKLKRLARPVDPWKLPIVERMEKAKNDLAIVAGVKTQS